MFQVNNVSINFDIVDVDENELSTLKTLIEVSNKKSVLCSIPLKKRSIGVGGGSFI